jgi:3-oxoacyl-[acyl-carrier protein] reductase
MTRVAIVTGGSSGIGLAAVDLLRQRDVAVAVFDPADKDPVDVSDADSVARGIARVRQTLGRIDIVVNCAGVPSGGRITDDDYLASWERSLAVNVTGAMLVVRACTEDLIQSGAGRIVNVASTEALAAGRNTGPYTVSKHALLGFTRTLAVDLGRFGVTANCVCPGATMTGMTAAIPEQDQATFARRNIPAGRYGTPAEIAHMIVSLTDPAASFVNGAVVTVDGGMTAQGR